MEPDPLLTMTDFRRAFCAAGIARRLALAGIDVDDFIQNGARASELFGRGYDAHVQRVIEVKEAFENGR